jgi:hypothetical protein
VTHLKLLSVVLLASLAGASGTAPPASAEDKAALRLHAFAVDVSGAERTRAGALEIAIERWSTDEERDRLRAILIESGADALLSALQKVKPRAGYIRTSSSLGWDIHYAREEPVGDGGRRVIIATDRPMSFWELRNQPRSVQYDFTLAEIRLNKDGKGEGKLARAAKISWDPGTRTIEIENYAIEPVRLTEVRVEASRSK